LLASATWACSRSVPKSVRGVQEVACSGEQDEVLNRLARTDRPIVLHHVPEGLHPCAGKNRRGFVEGMRAPLEVGPIQDQIPPIFPEIGVESEMSGSAFDDIAMNVPRTGTHSPQSAKPENESRAAARWRLPSSREYLSRHHSIELRKSQAALERFGEQSERGLLGSEAAHFCSKSGTRSFL